MLCCNHLWYVSMRPISRCVSFLGGNSTPRLDLPVCTASLIIGLFLYGEEIVFSFLSLKYLGKSDALQGNYF